jgi:two-component system response regulator YesN
MPEISGIELMDEIRRLRPDCRVVFLTAHDVFEYAYAALKIPTARFLLKTESYTTILDTIDGCVREIEGELRARELAARSDEQMRLIQDLKKKEYLGQVIHGYDKVTQTDLDELGLNFKADMPVYLILASFWREFDRKRGAGETEEYRKSIDQAALIPSILTSRIGGCIHCEIAELQYGMACFTAQQGDETRPAITSALMDALEDQDGEVSFACEASFALSAEPCSWEACPAEYKRLKSMLTRAPEEGGFVCAASGFSDGGSDDKNLRMAEKCRKSIEALQVYLESGYSDGFRRKLAESLEYMYRVYENHQRLGRELVIRLNLFFLSFVNRIPDTEMPEKAADLLRRLQIMDPDAMLPRQRYIELAEAILTYQSNAKQMLTRSSIERVRQYIGAHLGDDISLTRLARIAHFNPKYLSKLFSSETGVNLSDYIADKRRDEAKRLIVQGNMKIQDISAAVGFFSPAYFTRFFKKATGMTPQQYKEIGKNDASPNRAESPSQE